MTCSHFLRGLFRRALNRIPMSFKAERTRGQVQIENTALRFISLDRRNIDFMLIFSASFLFQYMYGRSIFYNLNKSTVIIIILIYTLQGAGFFKLYRNFLTIFSVSNCITLSARLLKWFLRHLVNCSYSRALQSNSSDTTKQLSTSC